VSRCEGFSNISRTDSIPIFRVLLVVWENQNWFSSTKPQVKPCKRLRNERTILKSSVLKEGKWPVSKSELTNGNLKQFINHIKSMDLEKINQSNK
jgi:hypothetical protein